MKHKVTLVMVSLISMVPVTIIQIVPYYRVNFIYKVCGTNVYIVSYAIYMLQFYLKDNMKQSIKM